MHLRVLPKGQVPRFVGALMADYRVVAPVAKGPQFRAPESSPSSRFGGQFGFDPIEDPAEIRLDYNTTILPPKTALQPPKERVVRIRFEGEPVVETTLDAVPTVLFGVHTCDLHAIPMLDRAFSADYPDGHYLERRKKTLIVSLECLSPCDEHSFCKDMGTMAADSGYDLHLTDIGAAYTVDIGTEAGAALLEKYEGSRAAADGETGLLQEALSAKWPRFRNRLTFDSAELPSLLTAGYNHPVWKQLGDRCLACGSCTNVCPTCYCFNVTDSVELSQTSAVRTRNWDSCQLEEFALVAGGENFREARAARQRHRMLRKGKYLRERFGTTGCVGCGRCVRACLVHINIVDTYNAIKCA
jgi:NAD-dependent dihydropyrimidine dehydrogenase PreA subunit